jgi:hypothetical protein
MATRIRCEVRRSFAHIQGAPWTRKVGVYRPVFILQISLANCSRTCMMQILEVFMF